VPLLSNAAELLNTIAIAISAFAATNIDDILVLTVLFAQVSSQFRPHHILTGQYLGFTAIILASLPGFLGGQVIPARWVALLGLLPIALGIRALFKNNEDDEIQTVSETGTASRSPLLRWVTRWIAPQTLQVAAITVANGGDNIGIYLPLFANLNSAKFLVTLVVFFSLVSVWYGIAAWLAAHPKIAPILTRFGDRLVPLVLISLGIFILVEGWH